MDAAPLRILHAIHDFLPKVQAGSEIYAFDLCRELLHRGHHVTVVCATFDPQRPHGQVEWRVVGGVPVVEITNNWICRSFQETYRDPVMTGRLDSVLQAVQPDVLHVHNLLNLSFDLPGLARARGARVVATLHDYTLVCPSGGQRLHQADRHVCHQIEPDRCARCFGESPFGTRAAFGRLSGRRRFAGPLMLAARAARTLAPRLTAAAASQIPTVPATAADITRRLASARSVFDEVDVFAAPSTSIRDEFVALGLPEDRVRVSDYGFHPRTAQRRVVQPHGRLRIGFVGTPVWHKGLHVLLDAIRRLPADSYSLTVHGDLRIFPDYVARLRASAAGRPVRFAGPFQRENVDAIYADLDALVVPSLWLENSPLVIHEALMSGVPVVGSDIGGIPDLIRHGENGLLFEAGAPLALAEALRMLLDTPALLERMSSYVSPIKSMAEDATEWETVYRTLAGPSAAAPAS